MVKVKSNTKKNHRPRSSVLSPVLAAENTLAIRLKGKKHYHENKITKNKSKTNQRKPEILAQNNAKQKSGPRKTQKFNTQKNAGPKFLAAKNNSGSSSERLIGQNSHQRKQNSKKFKNQKLPENSIRSLFIPFSKRSPNHQNSSHTQECKSSLKNKSSFN